MRVAGGFAEQVLRRGQRLSRVRGVGCGVAQWQSAGLITRRVPVQVGSPLPAWMFHVEQGGLRGYEPEGRTADGRGEGACVHESDAHDPDSEGPRPECRGHPRDRPAWGPERGPVLLRREHRGLGGRVSVDQAVPVLWLGLVAGAVLGMGVLAFLWWWAERDG